jgi:hypothetical protein
MFFWRGTMDAINKSLKFGLCLFSVFCFLSCGLEEYHYVDPVPSHHITRVFNQQSIIRLPDLSNATEFRHFTIYYRIYISGVLEAGEIQTSYSVLSSINPSLASDYSSLSSYFTSTTAVNMDTVFRGRGYYSLEVQGANIDTLLNTSSFNNSLVISFPPNPGYTPYLQLGGSVPFNLLRSNGNGSFNPLPANRYFFNAPELYTASYITSTINADTVNNSSLAPAATRYSYAAMYIVVTGADPNFTPIFSNPTFVGILRLQDP